MDVFVKLLVFFVNEITIGFKIAISNALCYTLKYKQDENEESNHTKSFRSQSAFGQAIYIYLHHMSTHNLLINSIISYNSIRLLAITKDHVSMNACTHATIYGRTHSPN